MVVARIAKEHSRPFPLHHQVHQPFSSLPSKACWIFRAVQSRYISHSSATLLPLSQKLLLNIWLRVRIPSLKLRTRTHEVISGSDAWGEWSEGSVIVWRGKLRAKLLSYAIYRYIDLLILASWLAFIRVYRYRLLNFLRHRNLQPLCSRGFFLSTGPVWAIGNIIFTIGFYIIFIDFYVFYLYE